MIKFVFGKITHLWVMENRLESERAAEKHTQGGFAWLRQTQKRRKYSSSSGRLPDYTEAGVQGTDTYCAPKGCQVSVLQVRIRSDTSLRESIIQEVGGWQSRQRARKWHRFQAGHTPGGRWNTRTECSWLPTGWGGKRCQESVLEEQQLWLKGAESEGVETPAGRWVP